jgi:YHS domain-containing protein
MRTITTRAFLAASIAVGAIGFAAAPVHAQSRTGGTPNQLDGGVAIKGYDTVAYFTENKAVKGTDDFKHDWSGTTWLFASAANRDAFAKEPARYAPQYGGFCAFGLAKGKLINVDPQNAWRIVDGKLYLNYNTTFLEIWAKDQARMISDANANWPKINN